MANEILVGDPSTKNAGSLKIERHAVLTCLCEAKKAFLLDRLPLPFVPSFATCLHHPTPHPQLAHHCADAVKATKVVRSRGFQPVTKEARSCRRYGGVRPPTTRQTESSDRDRGAAASYETKEKPTPLLLSSVCDYISPPTKKKRGGR
ncbi:6473_t:CDS:2, partial [Acaulospora colombiana]